MDTGAGWLPRSLLLSPAKTAVASAVRTLKGASLFAAVFGPRGHTPCWLSQVGGEKPVPLVDVLIFGALEAGSRPFTPPGEAGSWVFPPRCMVQCWGWGLWWGCV